MAPTRAEQIRALKEEVFDVLVIGGGCVGSGGAFSRRGLFGEDPPPPVRTRRILRGLSISPKSTHGSVEADDSCQA